MEKIFKRLNNYFCGKWRLAVLDFKAGRWLIKPQFRSIPYLRAENANGRHILIQPLPEIQPFYLLVDDVDCSIVLSHHRYPNRTWKQGRMLVETSPGNYQVWIHSKRFLTLTEKRYWLRKLKSDPGADPNNRWGRCPGFRNRKDKYRDPQGLYPLSKLLWVDWKNKAVIPSGNVKSSPKHQKALSHQPHGGVCLNKYTSRKDYCRENDSVTDFSYALALARRGCSEEYIRYRILTERINWENHLGGKRKEDYLDRTVKKALLLVIKTKNHSR